MTSFINTCLRHTVTTLSLGLLLGQASLAYAGFEGDWNMPDGPSGGVSMTITLVPGKDGYRGLLKSFPGKPNAKEDDVCSKCPGAKKGAPLKGLEMIWGLKPEGTSPGAALVEGYFLVPDDGQIMRCQMRLSADGKTLHLKIYAGLPIFGTTMDLVR
jgi:hypothetical protein